MEHRRRDELWLGRVAPLVLGALLIAVVVGIVVVLAVLVGDGRSSDDAAQTPGAARSAVR